MWVFKNDDCFRFTGGHTFYACLNNCGRNYKYKGSMMQHFQICGKRKPFICRVCDKGFTRMAHLKYHTLVRHNTVSD